MFLHCTESAMATEPSTDQNEPTNQPSTSQSEPHVDVEQRDDTAAIKAKLVVIAAVMAELLSKLNETIQLL